MNARVTILRDVVLPDGTGDAAVAFDAEVLSLEQPLMQLAARQYAACGTALRIDTSDAVWLGEVEQCSQHGDDFSVRIRLRHVLRDFETLARLAERFGGTVLPRAFGAVPGRAVHDDSKGNSETAPAGAPVTF
jgi:hypothetical protein